MLLDRDDSHRCRRSTSGGATISTSVSGVFAPWLAHLTGRVDAVVSGGWLDRHGLKHASFPGHEHEGMLAHINEAVPSVLAWFDGLPRAE